MEFHLSTVHRRENSLRHALRDVSRLCTRLVIDHSLIVLADKEVVDALFELVLRIPPGFTLDRSIRFKLNQFLEPSERAIIEWLGPSSTRNMEQFAMRLLRGLINGKMNIRFRTPLHPRFGVVPAPIPSVPFIELVERCLRAVPRFKCSFEATAQPQLNHLSVDIVWKSLDGIGATARRGFDSGFPVVEREM